MMSVRVCVMNNCLSEFHFDSDQYSIFIYSFFCAFTYISSYKYIYLSIYDRL